MAPKGLSCCGASTVRVGGLVGEEVLTVIDERINLCARFAECRCPPQAVAERVYLIPQALDAFTIGSYEKQCLRCGQFVRRDIPSATNPGERNPDESRCPQPVEDYGLSNGD